MKNYFIDWHLILCNQDISLCNAMVSIHFAKSDRMELIVHTTVWIKLLHA
jgi:hypothetical protein